jgi:hypothetical protein
VTGCAVRPSADGDFLPYNELVGTMLHELVHMVSRCCWWCRRVQPSRFAMVFLS